MMSTAAETSDASSAHGHGHSGSPIALAIGAIGVVFGDIGTSPLYAFRETFASHHGAPGISPDVDHIHGVLSLVFWSMMMVVTVKYVLTIMRADNGGEGGSLALLALIKRRASKAGWTGPLILLGVFATALFYGDSMITPAISVLSATEGLQYIVPGFKPWIVPTAVAILFGLFAIQSRGTDRVGKLFGPIMLTYFSMLAVLGVMHLAADPSIILHTINPLNALKFFADDGFVAFVALGSVVLAVTGAEALYADMGHFGRKPIGVSWLTFVYPALMLNYMGQGALILSQSSPAEAAALIKDPFFLMIPDMVRVPVIILALLATIIASQAVITGAFSLTRQAIQLGLLPRLEIRHTSETTSGQIYIPRINIMLLVVVLLLVWTFRTSSNLSHAYGISVFGAMMVDSLLAFIVIWKGWRWSLAATLAVVAPFLIIDVAFFSANMLKLFSGGYVPVLLAVILVILMWTWVRGTKILFDKTRKTDVPLLELVGMLSKSPPYRVKGMAVFLTSDPETAPASLLHNLKHNKVLHERNVILTVRSADTPRVAEEERVRLSRITDDFWRVDLVYGYMESPNVPKGLAVLRKQGFKFDIMSTSFFLSRRSIKASPQSGMPVWQDNLYISLTKSATDATSFFQIPTGRVVEVGTQVTV